MRTVIYSRVSTLSQTVDNQLASLTAQYPHAEVFQETASGIKNRPVLNQLVEEMKSGDILIVAALDRLGRKTSEILLLIERLEQKGVVLKSQRESIDFSTIAGRLVCQILVSISEMERRLISQRTRDALAARRAKGIVGGRPPKYSKEQIEEIKLLRAQGLSIRAIANRTGISISRVHRLL